MALTEAGAQALALLAREAADSADMSHKDLCSWLSDAVRECMPEGCWCYFIDFIGDGESGKVIYCCDGDLMQAPYAITKSDAGVSVKIDSENAVDVAQMTTYVPEADEESYAGEAKARERQITKKMRDDAGAGDFAGKNKSFPILKKGDVKAAVSSMGRAGAGNFSTAQLKANIIRIAKKKGFEGELPKEWTAKQEAASREAGARHSKTDQDLIQNIHDHSLALGATPATPESNDNGVDESSAIDVVGDVIPLREGAVGQDGTAYLKLIAPGWGSCGFYPDKVLERDGPNIFKNGTKNFWNHQTEAEEAARPEGDLRDLASVLTEDAHYEPNGPAGAGLYAKANVFEKFRAPVDSLAKHIGMSIRANGKAKEGVAPDGRKGKIIEQLTHGISVDYVTTPGAGGQILQLFEAARGRAAQPQPPVAEAIQENSMDAAELQKLQEGYAATQAEVKKLRERQAIQDAGGAVAEYFKTVQVTEAIRERVTSRVLAGTIPVNEAGDLDRAKVKEFAEAQLNDELAFLRRMNPSLVVGMGPAQTGTITEAQREAIKERKAAIAVEVAESNDRYLSLMGFGDETQKRGRKILLEGRRSFDVNYNSRNRGAVLQGASGTFTEAN